TTNQRYALQGPVEFSGFLPMNHCVSVLHAHSISAAVLLHDIHHLVVGLAPRPIALKFKHGLNPSHRYSTSLNNPLHSHIGGHLRHGAAMVSNDVNLVAGFDCLNCRESDADLGPKPSHNYFLPAGRLDRGDVVLILPRIHARSLYWLVIGVDRG